MEEGVQVELEGGPIVNIVGELLSLETVLCLLVGILVGLLAYFALSKLTASSRSSGFKSRGERQFRSVFAIMDEAGVSL